MTNLERTLLRALRVAEGRLKILAEGLEAGPSHHYASFIRSQIRAAIKEAQRKD